MLLTILHSSMVVLLMNFYMILYSVYFKANSDLLKKVIIFVEINAVNILKHVG